MLLRAELTEQQWDIVGKILATGRFCDVASIIASLNAQFAEQTQPKEQAPSGDQ